MKHHPRVIATVEFACIDTSEFMSLISNEMCRLGMNESVKQEEISLHGILDAQVFPLVCMIM